MVEGTHIAVGDARNRACQGSKWQGGSVTEPIDPDDPFTQAVTFFGAMGEQLFDASELPPVPDAHEEVAFVLTRAEIAAVLPLLRAAQHRAQVSSDPWSQDQQQWWALTRSRLERAFES